MRYEPGASQSSAFIIFAFVDFRVLLRSRLRLSSHRCINGLGLVISGSREELTAYYMLYASIALTGSSLLLYFWKFPED